MDKNNKEKEMLYQWAKLNSGVYCFQEIDRTKESYYEKEADNENFSCYVRKYGVETLPELLKELDALWGTDEIMCQVKKVIGVAAMRNKPVKKVIEEENKSGGEDNSEEKLPAFIYNF